MAFEQDPSEVQFADLKAILATSKVTDNALSKMLHVLIDRLDLVKFNNADIVQNINNSVNTITSIVTYLTNNTATYLTTDPEAVALPNSSQLLAGDGIIFDESVPNQLTISAEGGGAAGPHAPTHEPGGSDPLHVDAAPNVGSLRTLGSGPNQAAPGNAAPNLHAPTHSNAAADPVNVLNLAGYPGGTAAFLRADHTFAVPPGGGGGVGMNLDYLGNYVQGPVYNDGDIVIGSDGVAYMCTVDGTTTPPEPWPGTGAAVNVALDAKYWVVSPHTSLVNARPLNGLGTGYVRSTVGEPSVVPTIPLTDTTGILPDNRLTSNVALKNIDNFFVSQTFASSVVSGNYPNLRFYAPTNGLDRKIWNVFNYVTGDFYIESVNDAVTLGVAQYKFGRDGTLVGPAFAGNGVQLTNLNAANLATGTVPLARLGTNAAAANLFLRGDNTWQPVDAFPSGLIVIAVGPCPIGWTRVGWDGYFIRGGPSYAAGGSDTHGHTFTSNAAGGHSHSGGTTDSPEHAHRFGVHGQWISSDNLNGQLNVDGGNSGNMSRGPHQHTVDVNWDADTGAGGAHNHGLNINGVGDHTHTGGTDAASNVPLHVLVSFCQKN